MIESKVWRMDYRRLNPTCTYCKEKATIIGVATTTTGDVLVKTLCEAHGKGEQEHCKKEGMVMAGETSIANAWTDATLMDPDIMREVSRMDVNAETMREVADALEERADELEERRDLKRSPPDPDGSGGSK